MEAYFAPTNDIKDTIYHVSILAQNKIGLKNLYKLVSISHLEYFYKKPIVIKNVLEENREGLLLGTACNMGELYQAILAGKLDEEIEKIADYYDYLEIQPISNNMYMIRDGIVPNLEALQDINKKIVELGEKLNKLVVATSDNHFLYKKEDMYRKILQEDQRYDESNEQSLLYLKTTQEMLKEFEYLGQDKAYEVVVTNTNKIADMCEKIKPISNEKCYPHMKNAEIELKELAYSGAYKIYGDVLPTQVQERLDKELKTIIENDFATLYMIAQKLVKKSNEYGYIVGNRGTSGSSLVAYCIGITETDPIKYNIPFETFSGFDGYKEPDFDLNFAEEIRDTIQEYVKEILEGVTTVMAGTIGTVADDEYVNNYYGNKNMKIGDIEIEVLEQSITRIKTITGHHPGGVIVVPEGREIYEFTPVQYAEDEPNSNIVTTHFSYHSIDRNLLKLDILGHYVPTMLHRLHELTGIDPITINLDDKETMEMVCTANTIDIPLFDTEYIRNIILETKPKTFADLIKIIALSHGTGLWKNNSQDLIKNGTATLNEIISCRDDIMNYLIEIGIEPKIAFEIMETIRKGKPACNKEPFWEDYKDIMKEHNVPEWYIKSCKKIKYLFPKAYAVGYVINSFRIAWYKVHYSDAFYKVYKEME